MDRAELLRLTAEVASSQVASTETPAAEVPALIENIFATLSGISNAEDAPSPQTDQRPAVPVRKSVAPDHLRCLECGAQLAMLRRHLQAAHGMTPDEYRAKWRLPADYPIVAPDYAARRSAVAIASGLGTKGRGGKE